MVKILHSTVCISIHSIPNKVVDQTQITEESSCSSIIPCSSLPIHRLNLLSTVQCSSEISFRASCNFYHTRSYPSSPRFRISFFFFLYSITIIDQRIGDRRAGLAIFHRLAAIPNGLRLSSGQDRSTLYTDSQIREKL